MSNPLENLLKQAGLKPGNFSPSSRYYSTDTAVFHPENGKPVVYLRRRFIPPAETFSLLEEHTVTEGERLDHIASEYLGDPERFWQICDANNTMDPAELTAALGKKIRITLPEGIPGNNNV